MTPPTAAPPAELTLDDINLLEDTWAAGVPNEQFRLLRREAPVFWHPHPTAKGFWAVTKHEDIKYISRHDDIFSTELGSTFLIVATARQGRSMAEIQSAIDEEIDRLRREPPDAREV